MEREIRILIADDHPVFLLGLKQVISSEPGLRIVAEARDGAAALERIRDSAPDIAVLDIHMPPPNGFEVARAIESNRLPTRILFLTMHKDEETFNLAMNIGVKGYVLKDSAITEIVESIKAVAAGQPYISPALSAHLLNRSRRENAPAGEASKLDLLTPTEKVIMKMVAEGKGSKDIGKALFLHWRTIDNHRTNISRKLGLQGSHSLVRFAIEHKNEFC